MSYTNVQEPALRSLVDLVGQHAKDLEEYYTRTNTPQPSFRKDGPSTALPIDAATSAHQSRMQLASAAYKLYLLAMGPSNLMPMVRANYQSSSALHWLCHFNIFVHVPVDSSISYQDLAMKANVPLSTLQAVVRMAIANAIFTETESNMIEHTSFSMPFAEFPDMASGFLFTFEVSMATSLKMAAATEKWPGSVDKTKTAHNLAFGHDTYMFDWMRQDEGRAKQFATYMRALSRDEGVDTSHLVKAYSEQDLPTTGLFVDVGGSAGHCCVVLAKSHPELRFEVQDLADTVAEGKILLSNQQQDISSRIAFRVHDFFKPQPVKGASVYFLRQIIHDWPDNEAVVILKQLYEAMERHSLILIMDAMLPRPGELPVTAERVVRVRDLTMRQKFNAKERDMDGWRELLGRVSDELEILDVLQPVGSELASLKVGFKAVSKS